MQTPVIAFLEQYKLAAAEGALVELKLRLLADKTQVLQKYAHIQKIEEIENEVAKHFGASLSDEDKQTLALCRQLRNKVLHCNFGAAHDKLGELGIKVQPGGVKKITLSEVAGASMLEKVSNAIVGNSSFQYVADTSSVAPGGIYGWLLELGSAGAFIQATEAFKNAVSIIDRLAAL